MDIQSVFPQFILKELPSTASTNQYVEELLKTQSLPEGSVIFTLNQSAGIGYADNKWESEPGCNMTATMVLNPRFIEASDQFYLTIVSSLTVADVVEAHAPNKKAEIKWPNDIYVDHRKIAGILIKNQISGSVIDLSIIGIGLNINQTVFKTAPNAISLKNISGIDFNVKEILSKWHKIMAEYYYILQHDRKLLMDKYLSRMYLKDVPADYLINERMVRARIKGIDRHGMLILCDEHNKQYNCGLKEIVFPVSG